MKKIKINKGETIILSNEQAKKYFEASADGLELLKDGHIAVLHFMENGKIVQSAFVKDISEIPNIDVWEEDGIEYCLDVLDIYSPKKNA